MKRKQLKVISLLLIVVMIVCMMPLTTSATDDTTPILENTAYTADEQLYTDTLDYDNPDVFRPITEIEERREENIKHFLLPDGQIEAVVYGTAVHRRNSLGEWKDIDNNLLADNGKLPNMYVTDDLRVAFAKSFSLNNQLFALNENGYGITMKLIAEPISTLPMQPITEIAPLSDKISTTTVTNAPTRGNKTEWNTVEEAITVNNTSSIIYTNVRSNTDLEYILEGNNIKENIIIRSAGDSYEYSFELGLSGLIPTICEDGSISLYDSESGNQKYTIPAPYMYDADGALSYSVYYTLTKNSDGVYILNISADSLWINETDRKFPVTIDPTIEHTIGYDTYIDANNPSTNYGSSSQLWISPTKTVFIKEDMPELPSGSSITNAKLYVAYYYYDNVISNSLTASAHSVNMNWSASSLNWSTANTYDNLGISTSSLSSASFSGEAGAYANTPKWVYFNVKNAVNSWYSGTANNGIAIKRISGTNTSVLLKSFESGVQYMPYFTITYIEPRVSNGVYKIKNVLTGKYIDVTDGNITDGTQLQQWSGTYNDGNRSQLFKITFERSVDTLNYYTVRPLTNCGQAINIPEIGETATVEDLPTTGTSAIPANQNIIITDMGGNYAFKIEGSSVERYLGVPSNGTNGSKLYAYNYPNSNALWILEPYNTQIDGITIKNYPANLLVNEMYTYKAVMYSSTIGRNGPVQYLVRNADGTETDKATINQSTGVLTALKPGTIRVGATYQGTTTYWYTKVDIKFENGIIYTLRNTSQNMFMNPSNSSAAADINLSELDQTNTGLMWKFEDKGDGYFMLKSELRTGSQYNGYYLCAPNTTTSGERITQMPYSETGSVTSSRVLWRFVRQSDGTFKIQSKNNEGTSLYLTTSNGYVVQSASNVTTWDIRPLIMNIKVLYDQAFATRYGENYMDILRDIYGNNSSNLSFAGVYKDRFGIRVNVTFQSTPYASLPYAENCYYKDDIDTICTDCQKKANNDINVECNDGYHHKNTNGFIDDMDNELISVSTNIQVLYTGHVVCSINSNGEHREDKSILGLAKSSRNVTVVFGEAFKYSIEREIYDEILRTTLHESFHNIGVPHCIKSNDIDCIMTDTDIETAAKLSTCSACVNTVNLNKLMLYNHQ